MRRVVIAALAILAVLALIVGILGFGLAGSSTPTLSLSSQAVHAGDTLMVNASHLPPNQGGELQLMSQLYTFPFRADGLGDLSAQVTVPLDIGTGDHLVRLCWSGSCHAQASFTVLAPQTLPTPTPLASPSPTSTPKATPTSTARTHITVSPSSGKARSSAVVSGFYFSPGRAETIDFIQLGTATRVAAAVPVASNGTFRANIVIPSFAVVGNATIRACGSNGCFTVAFRVTLL